MAFLWTDGGSEEVNRLGSRSSNISRKECFAHRQTLPKPKILFEIFNTGTEFNLACYRKLSTPSPSQSLTLPINSLFNPILPLSIELRHLWSLNSWNPFVRKRSRFFRKIWSNEKRRNWRFSIYGIYPELAFSRINFGMILMRLRAKKMDAGLCSLRFTCSDFGSLRCMGRGGRSSCL
jgi:hypothetical protein